MFNTLMQFCSALISIYTILIIVRIMMSWFTGPASHGRAARFLMQLTDPYLSFFRGFRFFRFGLFDFSPVLALIVLSVAGNVFLSLAAFQQVTLGLVLALLIARIWSALAFFLGMFIILIVLRLIGILTRFNAASPFWRYIDMILNPVLAPLTRLFFRGRRIPYMTGLIAGGLFLLFVRIFGEPAITQLVLFIQKIPF
ncbi:MAG: YggT family protein [Spirochaetales bacterium]|jgi:YggT family protein|nr:YggT family protein [Spirochaetales bacterium]